MHYTYTPEETCSTRIDFDIEEERRADGSTCKVIRNVVYTVGCNGNLQGVARLVEGMTTDEVLTRLEGISCGGGPTSCPDQLCKAIRLANSKKAN